MKSSVQLSKAMNILLQYDLQREKKMNRIWNNSTVRSVKILTVLVIQAK